MGKVKITLVKSLIGRSDRQRRSIKALGLNKISSSSEHILTPQLQGAIVKVRHLVSVENI